jgi:hypothetical protein
MRGPCTELNSIVTVVSQLTKWDSVVEFCHYFLFLVQKHSPHALKPISLDHPKVGSLLENFGAVFDICHEFERL